MIENQRHLFDLPEGVTYLDCAARSPLTKAVARAGEAGVGRKVRPWTYTLIGINEEAARARGLFARLIGADAAGIAIQPATSYGVATAAANLPIAEGQAIVVLERQFPSNVYGWRRLAEAKGADIVTVKRSADGGWTGPVLDAIGAETAIAALPPCHWTDGSVLDLEAVAERCRETETASLIDATQAAGAMPIDVASLKPDFLVASAYKWLMCPYTLAFLYVSPERREGRPLEYHSWNHADAVKLYGAEGYVTELAADASRFDMGEINNIINMPMAVAALEQLNDWTPQAIAETLRPLTGAAAGMARDRGWQVPESHVDHFVGVRVPDGLPEGLWQALRDDDIHVSVRGSAIRISPHLYNEPADVERLFAALDRLIA